MNVYSRSVYDNGNKVVSILTIVLYCMYDSFKPKAALTSRELAIELQELRKEMDLQNTDIKRLEKIQKNYEMITQMPSLLKDANSPKYLHTRPDTNCTNVTCILENGSRFFLRKRINYHGNRGYENINSENGEPKTITASQSKVERQHGNLLSKSMEQLLKEADSLRIRNLTNKEKIKNEESEKDFTNSSHAEHSVHEKGLWVDKYAPKTFAQLLSPEKTNREVLKAMKLWDSYVFQPKTKTKTKTMSIAAGHDSSLKSKLNGTQDPFNGFGGSPKSVKNKNSLKTVKDDADDTNVTSTDNGEVRTHIQNTDKTS